MYGRPVARFSSSAAHPDLGRDLFADFGASLGEIIPACMLIQCSGVVPK
jgi:hypothetical protein